MSNVYYQQYNMPYGQRSRRTARPRQFNNKQKSVILQAAPQDVAQTAYARDLEAARSFDIEDDAVFCPGLLTEDDVRLPVVASHYVVSLTDLVLHQPRRHVRPLFNVVQFARGISRTGTLAALAVWLPLAASDE